MIVQYPGPGQHAFSIPERLVLFTLKVVYLGYVIRNHSFVRLLCFHQFEGPERFIKLAIPIADKAIIIICRHVVLVLRQLADFIKQWLCLFKLFQVKITIGSFKFGISDLCISQILQSCPFIVVQGITEIFLNKVIFGQVVTHQLTPWFVLYHINIMAGVLFCYRLLQLELANRVKIRDVIIQVGVI